jgi:hypothetical protein
VPISGQKVQVSCEKLATAILISNPSKGNLLRFITCEYGAQTVTPSKSAGK